MQICVLFQTLFERILKTVAVLFDGLVIDQGKNRNDAKRGTAQLWFFR